MKYVYPAIFTPLKEGYDVCIPDLPAAAAPAAIPWRRPWKWTKTRFLYGYGILEEEKGEIPPASATLPHEASQFIRYVKADTEAYRRQMDNRAVKKTLSIPAWLNHQAEAAHVNFSGILQETLKAHLHIGE